MTQLFTGPSAGDISQKRPGSVTVVDEESKLTVTFSLVAGALG